MTYTYSREISHIYTSDPDSVAILSPAFKALSFMIALISQMMTLQGTLKALLHQRIASIILVLCLYLVSLPMAYFLAFDMGVGL